MSCKKVRGQVLYVFLITAMGCWKDGNAPSSDLVQQNPSKLEKPSSIVLSPTLPVKLKMAEFEFAINSDGKTIQGLVDELEGLTSADGAPYIQVGPLFGHRALHIRKWFWGDLKNPITKLLLIGPAAIPKLVESLSNDSQTRIRIAEIMRDNPHKIRIGSRFAVRRRELSASSSFNPRNPREQVVLQRATPDKEKFLSKPKLDYVVRVGDVCMSVLGHIVNRQYPVMEDLTDSKANHHSLVIINSPVLNVALRSDLEELWGGKDYRHHVFQSFCHDVNGRVILGSTIRLAKYFPNKSKQFIHQTIEAISEGEPGDEFLQGTLMELRCVDRLSGHLQRRIMELVARSENTLQFVIGAYCLEKNLAARKLILGRANGIMRQIKEYRRPTERADCYYIVLLIAQVYGTEATQWIVGWVQLEEFARFKDQFKLVFRHIHASGDSRRLVLSLLRERSLVGWSRDIRICDVIAHEICRLDDRFEFSAEAPTLKRDEWVAKLIEGLVD